MYREQYGEYSYWCQGVQGQAIGSYTKSNDLKFSKEIFSCGRSFQAKRTAIWKVVTSRSNFPILLAKVIWRIEQTFTSATWKLIYINRNAPLQKPLGSQPFRKSFTFSNFVSLFLVFKEVGKRNKKKADIHWTYSKTDSLKLETTFCFRQILS